MLTIDPKKRIEWEDLFKHKINYYQEEKLKDSILDFCQQDLKIKIEDYYVVGN